MPEIKHQQRNSSPEISFAEIHIPDDADTGTGTFTTKFTPRSLPPVKMIMSGMFQAPKFQITATLNVNREMPVLLGQDPVDRVVFLLPDTIDRTRPHELRIEFAKWRIMAALFDGKPLIRKEPEQVH